MRECLTLVKSTDERSKNRENPEKNASSSGLTLAFICLTLRQHSSSQSALKEEGGASLLTAPPGRLAVVRSVVGKLDLTPTAGFDGVDLVVVSV